MENRKSEKVKGRRISFPALAPHNIAADCTDWASLSRVATPLKDPNQQNKYRDPPNIFIIPSSDLRNKSNNIYVLYISCTGKQEMRINLRQKRIKWCLLWPRTEWGNILLWAGHIFRHTQNYFLEILKYNVKNACAGIQKGQHSGCPWGLNWELKPFYDFEDKWAKSHIQ